MEDNKYQQGKIYKIECNITGEVYYGSTKKTLEKRLQKHLEKTNTCISKQILNRGDYEMILIKDYPCNSKKELEEEEAKYIRNNICINVVIPNRTFKELYEDNKKEINEKKKQDRKNNPEKYRQQDKNKYQKHKEKIRKKQKEKITCECGAIVRRNGLAIHKKSMKHIKLMECIILD